MKLKISNVEFEDRECRYLNDILIDIKSKPMHEIFDLEPEHLKYIVFREYYKAEPVVSFLEKMIYTQCLASLLKLDIIEDGTILKEVRDSFNVSLADNIKMIVEFESGFYDPYRMDFDRTKLKKEDDGTHTLHGEICVESNDRTTNYFRDVLLLINSEDNVLMINSNLDGTFDQHQFIEYTFSDSDEFASDKLGEYLSRYTSYSVPYYEVFNALLIELISDGKHIDKILGVIERFSLSDRAVPIIYNELYLNVVEMKSIKMKSPQILFNELIGSTNEDDIILGLKKLGFKMI